MSPVALLVDRFVSASSADDAHDSLRGILVALQSSVGEPEDHLEPSVVWSEGETLEAFLQVLTSGEYKGIPVDQGPPLVCQVYSELVKSRESSVILERPQRGRLVTSLLDVICNLDDPAYTRVSALQVMQKICLKYPSLSQAQLLEVPNGLHRLADIFREENEQVRNELLLLAKVIAQWPSCAKVWVFAEVCDIVIELAVQEGGLTNGNVLVMDCIDLLNSLLKHDSSLADLVWQSSVFSHKLSSLLDLRRGVEFLKPKRPRVNDDLDDILQFDSQEPKAVVPRLNSDEETLLCKVLDLIGVILGSESIRKVVWTQHRTLCSLVWELSLLSPPPSGVPHVCAVPSANLQQKALNCVAEFFASAETMLRHNGLDRLLYLVCTGGSSDKFEEKSGISQSALHVIRQTLSDDAANKIVMHTLAPSTSDDSIGTEPTVITKLLNTVLENLNGDNDLDRRKINLLGSLGALGLFMRDQMSREMMLRITAPYFLVDNMLKSLVAQDPVISLSFLRFLSDWMIGAPAIIEAILSSTQSTSLSVLFGSVGATAILSGLLLGIAMEYMDDQHKEKYGGWNRSSILSMISKRKGGISGFISDLEDLKTMQFPWKVCRLEENVFITWYSSQVLIVRSRIVQELTGGSVDDDDDDQGVSSRALQKLVAQQSLELRELQTTLAETKNELESSESRLRTWKRRVESTPTQLDDMLSEYTMKNVQLEGEITALRCELRSVKEGHEIVLNGKDDEICELRKVLNACNEREQESFGDIERLRGELSALSAAYSSLEEEFNRHLSTTPVTALSGEVPAAQPEGQQPEGEVSSQGQAGSEIDALRAENTRLRNEARAADEWMQLAHQRMGEIDSQNLGLLEEIAALKAIVDNANPQVDNILRCEQELGDTRARCSLLEDQIAALRASSALNEAPSGHLNDLIQIEQNPSPESKNENPCNKQSMLDEIAKLTSELQLARACSTALNEERHQLEVKLASLGSTEGELVNRLQADLQAKQHEVDSLRSRIEGLQDDDTIAKSQVGLSLGHGEDPRVVVTGDVSDARFNEVDQQELEQLREANFAAQEWMAKAVEHHQQLVGQVAALEADKKKLINELETSKNLERIPMSANIGRVEPPEDKLSRGDADKVASDLALQSVDQDLETELRKLKIELDDRTAEVRSLEARLCSPTELEVELAMLRKAKIGLDESFENQTLTILDLQAQLMTLKNENNAKTKEMEKMVVQLTEFELWAAAAQERLNRLDVEKENTEEHRLQTVSGRKENDQLECTLGNLMAENKNLSEQLEALVGRSNEVASLKAELEEQAGLVLISETNLHNARSELEETKTKSMILTKQLQDTVAELEAKIVEMKYALDNQKIDAAETAKGWKQHCEALKVQIETAESRVRDQYVEDSFKLESKISFLESSLAAELKEVDMLSSRCSELSDMIDELKKQNAALSEENLGVEGKLRAINDILENEQELNESLTMQIEVMEKELASTRLKLLEGSHQRNHAVASLEQELAEQKLAMTDYEARARLLDLNREEMRSDMDKLRTSTSREVEIVQGRNRELELALSSAEKKLEMNESEAATVLGEWQRHSEDLENERSALVKELEIERDRRVFVEQALTDAQAEIDSLAKQSEEAISQWQDVVAELEAQIEEQQMQALDAITQWEGECSELQTTITNLELSKDDISRILAEAVTVKLKDDIKWIRMLDGDHDLTDFNIVDKTPCTEVISLLSSQGKINDTKIVRGIQRLNDKVASQMETNKLLEADLKSKDTEIEQLTKDLVDSRALSTGQVELVASLETKCSDLETLLTLARNRVADVEVEIVSTRTQLNTCQADIASLRSHLIAADEKASELLLEKNDLVKVQHEMERELSATQRRIVETQKCLEEALAKRSEVEQALTTQKQLTQEIQRKWETCDEERRAQDSSHIQERSRCEAEIMRLQDDLKATTEAVQAHVTDVVSRRATEMATRALREEIGQMRFQMDERKEALLQESRARLAAEAEVTALKSDLAILLGLQDDESTDNRLKSLVMKTADDIQQKERHEIQELRKALERVLEELDSARVVEDDAMNRASSAELQASICEQEVIAAKSDVLFLTESLEQTREAESARASSLEYRINALEDDRDVVRRFHADELETLRQELSHCSMEKDHILHSLKESEKINAALVYSSAKERETDEVLSTENELSKLRTFTAKLLSSTTEEASRTERRIREAIVANSSLVEAEVIVERELRIAAEAALENMKSQLDEIQRSQLDESAPNAAKTCSPNRLQTQLSQSREKSRKLESENMLLRSELESLKSDAERKVSDLNDRCQRAQSLALKLEWEAKAGCEGNLEAPKMPSVSISPSSGNWVVVETPAQDMVTTTHEVLSIEAFDFVMEQKVAIQEERQLYQELLAEHDDLLALLAQQDLEKASLYQALMNVAGQTAVDAAIQEAEDKAVKQFGTYVQLT